MDTETESEPASHGPFSWAQQTTEPIEEEISPQPDEGLTLILDESLQPIVRCPLRCCCCCCCCRCQVNTPRLQVVATKVFYGVKHVEQGSDMYLHVNVKGNPLTCPPPACVGHRTTLQAWVPRCRRRHDFAPADRAQLHKVQHDSIVGGGWRRLQGARPAALLPCCSMLAAADPPPTTWQIQVVERNSNGAKVQAFVTGFEKASRGALGDMPVPVLSQSTTTHMPPSGIHRPVCR
jgi:hypothetical protein